MRVSSVLFAAPDLGITATARGHRDTDAADAAYPADVAAVAIVHVSSSEWPCFTSDCALTLSDIGVQRMWFTSSPVTATAEGPRDGPEPRRVVLREVAQASVEVSARRRGEGRSQPEARMARGGRAGDVKGSRVTRAPTDAQAPVRATPVTVDTVTQFLYDLHLRAHTLPQDSYRRWLTAVLERQLEAQTAWLFDAVGPPQGGGTAAVQAWAEVEAARGARVTLVDGMHARGRALVALLPEQPGECREGPWLVLQRDDRDFDRDDIAQLRLLRLHLGLGLALNRWEQRVRQNGPTSRLGRAHGVSDRQGRLLQADPEFLTLLRREWPGSREHLPELLRPLLCGVGGRRVGDLLVVSSVPIHGDAWLWVLRPRHDVDLLSERQRVVARMFADGRNYREIAAALQLAPATIRRHIQTAYARLGVRRKIELAQLLADVEQPAE